MSLLLRRGKISWLIENKIITAFDKIQATAYYMYSAPNEHCLNNMRKTLVESKETEYSTWADVIELAQKHHLKGYSTSIPTLDNPK